MHRHPNIPPGLVSGGQVTNASSAPVHLVGTRASCGCMAGELPTNITLDPGATHEFQLAVNLAGSHGPVAHQFKLTFSDGSSRTIEFTAKVLRGVYPENPDLRLASATPGEIVRRELRLLSDDGQPYEIVSADAPLAHSVAADQAHKTVIVAFLNENKVAALQDTLAVKTTHAHAPELRIPIQVSFDLTWALEPTAFFITQANDEEFTQRTVRVISKPGIAFTVAASAHDDFQVTPLSSTAAPEQQVQVRVRRPQVRGSPRRVTVPVRTTLPDAALLDVPFLFYR